MAVGDASLTETCGILALLDSVGVLLGEEEKRGERERQREDIEEAMT